MIELKLGKGEKFHRPNGQFASYSEIESFTGTLSFEYQDFSATEYKRTGIAQVPRLKTDFAKVDSKLGKFVKRDYAYTYYCTCKAYEYQITVGGKKIFGDRIITIKHHVSVSSDSENSRYVDRKLIEHHNRYWPDHELQNAELTQIIYGEKYR